ncbi:hypothetical protein IVB69_01990 [Flavobacterium sp. J49]|uniref:hypothetical protein n=1 Tax=Flavobacterium sp. J49 TaxID=2718534 RepID=UPI001594BDD4|nr:hypothetical protein [Flavobacterium sp. J49]MBF6640242.1 hypothetical protein [Flavobacterium sp. J49]NIC01487.1 hypothetical protein [Flavobacterium sp. J49]
MEDFQSILDVNFPFVKNLLKEYGEFNPLACAVNINRKVEQVLLEEYDGEDAENDFPKATSLIGELKKELRWKRNEFVAIAIFYDVKLKEKQTDAVAVFVEHKEEKQAYTFYYPYKLIDNNPVFAESWKVIEEMEIFNS